MPRKTGVASTADRSLGAYRQQTSEIFIRSSKNRDLTPACGSGVSVANSLTALFPDVAAEWHPTKNGHLSPTDVVAGSARKVWWKCPKGEDHEWEATLANRTHSRSGCPYCRGFRVSVTNSLASRFPELAAEWHPTKNGELTPADVAYGSGRKVWWKCPNGDDHEFIASPNTRTSYRGCPYCAGKRISETNSLESAFPEIAAEWHPIKNGDLTPAKIVAGSQTKVWWKCPKGEDHEWEATVSSRTRSGNGCPCCGGYKPSVTNSLASRFREIAAEWHPTKNGGLTSADVVAGSERKVWWRCSNDEGHEWEVTLKSRTVRRKLVVHTAILAGHSTMCGCLCGHWSIRTCCIRFHQLNYSCWPSKTDSRQATHVGQNS